MRPLIYVGRHECFFQAPRKVGASLGLVRISPMIGCLKYMLPSSSRGKQALLQHEGIHTVTICQDIAGETFDLCRQPSAHTHTPLPVMLHCRTSQRTAPRLLTGHGQGLSAVAPCLLWLLHPVLNPTSVAFCCRRES